MYDLDYYTDYGYTDYANSSLYENEIFANDLYRDKLTLHLTRDAHARYRKNDWMIEWKK